MYLTSPTLLAGAATITQVLVKSTPICCADETMAAQFTKKFIGNFMSLKPAEGNLRHQTQFLNIIIKVTKSHLDITPQIRNVTIWRWDPDVEYIYSVIYILEFEIYCEFEVTCQNPISRHPVIFQDINCKKTDVGCRKSGIVQKQALEPARFLGQVRHPCVFRV